MLITLVRTRDTTLTVRDWGRGIQTGRMENAQPPSLGVGILGMTERIQQLGGTLRIHALPRGTVVRATVPYEEVEA